MCSSDLREQMTKHFFNGEQISNSELSRIVGDAILQNGYDAHEVAAVFHRTADEEDAREMFEEMTGIETVVEE